MVRIAINGDSRVLAEMAVQMWDSHTVDELEAEFVETLNDKQSAFFMVLHKFRCIPPLGKERNRIYEKKKSRLRKP